MQTLPVVGSKGFYDLISPYDAESNGNVEFECMAVRRISDYLADNKDPKAEIYEAMSIDSSVWEEDVTTDAYIVSLRTMAGHWVYVPARYIKAYPSVNGVEYRSLMIAVSLPSIPVKQDLSNLMIELKSIAEITLGVTCAVNTVETSKVAMVPFETHEATVQARAIASAGRGNIYARYAELTKKVDQLRARNQVLEQYILDHHT